MYLANNEAIILLIVVIEIAPYAMHSDAIQIPHPGMRENGLPGKLGQHSMEAGHQGFTI